MSPAFTSIVNAIGWSLIHFVWQGALLAGVLAVVLILLTHANPKTRYLLACGTLLTCMVLPIVSFDTAIANPGPLGPNDISNAHVGAVAGGMAKTDALLAWVGPHLPMLVLTWLCCVALMTIRMGLGLLWVARLDATASRELPHGWQSRFASLASKYALRRAVSLRVVADLATPMTAGWWRPIVFVPAALITGMPADLLEALLAHELAHIKRHDYIVNLMQTVIEVLLFFHPAVWWISRQIRTEREKVADDLAARTLGEPRRLALALQKLEMLQPSGHSLAQAADGGSLPVRIKRLVSPHRRPVEWKSAPVVVALIAASAAIYAQTSLPAADSSQVVRGDKAKATGRVMLAMTIYRDDKVTARPAVLMEIGQVAEVRVDDLRLVVTASAMSSTSVDLTLEVSEAAGEKSTPRRPIRLKAKIGQDISAAYLDQAGRRCRVNVRPQVVQMPA